MNDVLPDQPLPVHPMLAFNLPWNSHHWSCAYDTAIFMIWSLLIHTNNLCEFNGSLSSSIVTHMAQEFVKIRAGTTNQDVFIHIHNAWREEIFRMHPSRFPTEGRTMASLSFLLDTVCTAPHAYSVLMKICKSCHIRQPLNDYKLYLVSVYEGHSAFKQLPEPHLDISHVLKTVFKAVPSGNCPSCGSTDLTELTPVFPSSPPFIIVEVFASTVGDKKIKIENCISFDLHNVSQLYELCCIAYHGGDHFVAKSFGTGKCTWLYDGMLNHGEPWLAYNDSVN